jgi:HlyD family secretion protein
MKKILSMLITTILITTLLTGCGEEETADSEDKVSRDQNSIKQVKEVEIFQLGKDIPLLSFTKTATANSEQINQISAQISGNITDIHVKVGDKVEKNDLLITLGDSIVTDSAQIQYETALKSLNLALESQKITDQTVIQNIEMATISVRTAQNSYSNAVNSKRNSENTFNEQYENADLAVENAEKAYKLAKNAYNDLSDTVEDLEDDIDDLEDEIDQLPYNSSLRSSLESQLHQLENSLDSAERQEDSAKYSKETAQNAIEQAENALTLTEKNLNAQFDQLDFAITTAYNQYHSTLKQFESTVSSTDLQQINVENQILQARAAVKSAKLNINQKHVQTHIDGTITSLLVEESDTVAPGTPLIIVENPENLLIKTTLNVDEADFVEEGDKVEIAGNRKVYEGKVISKSPSLNAVTKKIDLEIIIEEENDLTPGEFVKVKFKKEETVRLFVPLNSVFLIDSQNIVKIINNQNTIDYQEVETGKVIGSYIEITSGLDENEKIVKTTEAFIEEGDKVKIIKN